MLARHVAKILIDVHSHGRHAGSAGSERKAEYIISDLGFNAELQGNKRLCG